MPYSVKQQKWAGAQLGKMREGKPHQSGMSEEQLKDFASGPVHSKKVKQPGGSIHDVEVYDGGRGESSTKAIIRASDNRAPSEPQNGESIPVRMLRSDTSFEVHEIDPHRYGYDWAPLPLVTRTYDDVDCQGYVTEHDQWEQEVKRQMGEWPEDNSHEDPFRRYVNPDVKKGETGKE